MFGALGSALARNCISFVSKAAHDRKIGEKYGLQKIVRPVYGTRTLGKSHMIRNDFAPDIEVDPQTFAVKVDGVHATVKPPKTIALNQLYFFS